MIGPSSKQTVSFLERTKRSSGVPFESVFQELKVSGCTTSLMALTDFSKVPWPWSPDTFCSLMNAMRLSRCASQIASGDPDDFIEAIIAELLLSSDYSVIQVMNRHFAAYDIPTNESHAGDLKDLLDEIKVERANYRWK